MERERTDLSSGTAYPAGYGDASRPRVTPDDQPDCMASDDFDCSVCTFIQPERCDYRADHSLLNWRRRFAFARKPPLPGLETHAFEALAEADRGMSYHELARRVAERRGDRVSPVILLEAVSKRPDLFLHVGQGTFRAISRVLSFESPTDNLWLRLPPFDPSVAAQSVRDAKRSWLGKFFIRLEPGARTLGDVVRGLLGAGWSRLPTTTEIGDARKRLVGDPGALAALDLIENYARRMPRPGLDEPIDADTIILQADAARSRMAEGNLRLVANAARRLAGRGLDYVDLCQEGSVGLMTAVDRFDPYRGFQFSTMATWWIRQAMTRAIADKARLIRVPVHYYEKAPWLIRERIPHRIPLGEPPGLWPVGSLNEVPERRMRPLSVAGDEVEEVAELRDLRDRIHEALEHLTQRERRVLELRFGLTDGRTRTLEEVGREFGRTRERIRQIEAKALKRLRLPARRLHALLPSRPRPQRAGLWRPLLQRKLTEVERYVLGRRVGLPEGPAATFDRISREIGVPQGQVVSVWQGVLSKMDPMSSQAVREFLYGRWHGLEWMAQVESALRDMIGTLPVPPAAPEFEQTKGRPLDHVALDDRERLVLNLRFGFDGGRSLSTDEIAAVIDSSESDVRKWLARGLAKLPEARQSELVGIAIDPLEGTSS